MTINTIESRKQKALNKNLIQMFKEELELVELVKDLKKELSISVFDSVTPGNRIKVFQ